MPYPIHWVPKHVGGDEFSNASKVTYGADVYLSIVI